MDKCLNPDHYGVRWHGDTLRCAAGDCFIRTRPGIRERNRLEKKKKNDRKILEEAIDTDRANTLLAGALEADRFLRSIGISTCSVCSSSIASSPDEPIFPGCDCEN